MFLTRDNEIWNIISVVREIGEEVELPTFEKPLKVVSNENFAVKVIQEVSTAKYFYHIEAPIMYCLHFGIMPANLEETIKLIKNALKNLGWKVPA